MILPESNIKTESSGILESTSFGINQEDVGIILNILRTKIYKNPILAVCREYSCNARDAHIEVHDNPSNPTTADTPIEIYLPNEFEPTLKIKDFGSGISPERKDIFVKFGASTKRSDNKQMGGFGIGCKSGYAYTQSFSVETVVDGTKYIYNAYIDETQVGKMDLIYKGQTDERNGTTILIPIKPNDFAAFAKTIIKCTRHWKVKPKLFGGLNERPEYPIFTKLFSGTGWILYADNSNNNYDSDNYAIKSPLAIIDGVEYPIDYTSIPGRNELRSAVLQAGFCMEFNIGELSLSANRDHLHYDDATCKKINDRIDIIADELKDIIINSVKDMPTYMSACRMYGQIKNTIPYIVEKLKGLTWNGHSLKTKINASDIGKWAKLTRYSYDGVELFISRTDKAIHINDPKTLFMYNDKTRHLGKHVILWLLEQYPECKNVQVLYTPESPSSVDFKRMLDRYGSSSDLTKVEYNMDLIKLLDPMRYSAINVPKAKYVSSYQAKARQKLESGNVSGYRLSASNGRSGYSYSHETAQFPIDDGGIYVIFDYKTNACTTGIKEILPQHFDILAGFVGESIIGLSAKRAAKIKDKDGWIALDQAIQDKLKPFTAMASINELTSLIKQTYYTFKAKCPWRATKLADHFDKIKDANSPLLLWTSASKDVLDTIFKLSPAIPVYRWLGHNLPEVCNGTYFYDDKWLLTDGVAAMAKEVKTLYPLIWATDPSSSYADSLIDYINLIDERRNGTHIVASVPPAIDGTKRFDSVSI